MAVTETVKYLKEVLDEEDLTAIGYSVDKARGLYGKCKNRQEVTPERVEKFLTNLGTFCSEAGPSKFAVEAELLAAMVNKTKAVLKPIIESTLTLDEHYVVDEEMSSRPGAPRERFVLTFEGSLLLLLHCPLAETTGFSFQCLVVVSKYYVKAVQSTLGSQQAKEQVERLFNNYRQAQIDSAESGAESEEDWDDGWEANEEEQRSEDDHVTKEVAHGPKTKADLEEVVENPAAQQDPEDKTTTVWRIKQLEKMTCNGNAVVQDLQEEIDSLKANLAEKKQAKLSIDTQLARAEAKLQKEPPPALSAARAKECGRTLHKALDVSAAAIECTSLPPSAKEDAVAMGEVALELLDEIQPSRSENESEDSGDEA